MVRRWIRKQVSKVRRRKPLTFTWVGLGIGSDFTDPENWYPRGYPRNGDQIEFKLLDGPAVLRRGVATYTKVAW